MYTAWISGIFERKEIEGFLKELAWLLLLRSSIASRRRSDSDN
jgi:hypothetical protein